MPPYIAINVLTVPEGEGATLEQRFAARQGAVDGAPGFEHFELLRPLAGTQDYLVYTRWRSQADFEAWRGSQSFGQGHAQASGRPGGAQPAATGSTIWAFELVQQSDGAGAGAGPEADAAGSDPDAGPGPGAGSDDADAAERVHEAVPGIPTTDPGPRQAPGQGEQDPEELGTRPPEDPEGEPGFA